MQIEFGFVDQDVRGRISQRDVRQSDEELGKAAAEFMEKIRLSIDDHLKRRIVLSRVDFQASKAEQLPQIFCQGNSFLIMGFVWTGLS